MSFELSVRQVNSLSSIFYLKIIFLKYIFVSITCEYIPYRILQQKQSERLVITSFIWFPESAISL